MFCCEKMVKNIRLYRAIQAADAELLAFCDGSAGFWDE